MQIAIVTCRRLPEPDPDAAALDQALKAAGIEGVLVPWEDATARWEDYPLAVIRSTWNYYEDRDAFVAWAASTGLRTKLANPADIVRWNTDKTYLAEIEKRDVAIVPTEFVARGEQKDVRAVMTARGWTRIVIKPVVSAGSWRTARFDHEHAEEAQAFLDDLVRERGAMIQRYMTSVDGYGERAIVWLDGAISHAIRKSARFIGSGEAVSAEVPVADDERAFAERVIAPYAAELLYARIDVVRDETGALALMELELVEPSLFFVKCPRALVPFVRAIQRQAR